MLPDVLFHRDQFGLHPGMFRREYNKENEKVGGRHGERAAARGNHGDLRRNRLSRAASEMSPMDAAQVPAAIHRNVRFCST
mgnify:CR=1 FL=1